MTWRKRRWWALSWALWALLGFCLYRELPRDVGLKLCSLALKADERPLGFVGDELVVSMNRSSDPLDQHLRRLRIWNARTGWLITEVGPFLLGRGFESDRTYMSLEHGYVVAPPPLTDARFGTCTVCDLRTGAHALLPNGLARVLGFHPVRPLVALATTSDPDVPSRVAIVDLRARTTLGGWSSPSAPSRERESIAAAFFLHDADELLLMLKSSGDKHRIVRCRWDGDLLPGSIDLGEGYYHFERPHGDHMIAIATDYDGEHRSRLEVRNWRTGQRVFATDVWNDHLHPDYFDWIGPPAALADDGRSIFARGHGLVSLPGKGLLRDAVKGFETRRMGVKANAFWTEEHWGALIGNFDAPRYMTLAQRSMRDGSLIVRLVPGIEPDVFSEHFDLTATWKGDVFEWPPLVNWPLLLLCQAVLALPLVLLWALRRGRREGDQLLASASP